MKIKNNEKTGFSISSQMPLTTQPPFRFAGFTALICVFTVLFSTLVYESLVQRQNVEKNAASKFRSPQIRQLLCTALFEWQRNLEITENVPILRCRSRASASFLAGVKILSPVDLPGGFVSVA